MWNIRIRLTNCAFGFFYRYSSVHFKKENFPASLTCGECLHVSWHRFSFVIIRFWEEKKTSHVSLQDNQYSFIVIWIFHFFLLIVPLYLLILLNIKYLFHLKLYVHIEYTTLNWDIDTVQSIQFFIKVYIWRVFLYLVIYKSEYK